MSTAIKSYLGCLTALLVGFYGHQMWEKHRLAKNWKAPTERVEYGVWGPNHWHQYTVYWKHDDNCTCGGKRRR
jgi:hypothetical protein